MNATICDRCGKIAASQSLEVTPCAITLIIDGCTTAEYRKDMCNECRETTGKAINAILNASVPLLASAAAK